MVVQRMATEKAIPSTRGQPESFWWARSVTIAEWLGMVLTAS
jgi:hypothetical protein